MEKTGCKIICGAPTTLAVKGLMMMMMIRVHDSQAYRKMDVTRERISYILELREILLSTQTGFSLVNAAVACAVLESISRLEPSSIITESR